MNIILVAGIALGLLLVLGATIALVTGGSNRVNVDERLQEFTSEWSDSVPEDQLEENQVAVADQLDQVIDRGNFSIVSTIKSRLARADLKLRVVEYMGLVLLAAGVAGGLAYYFLGGTLAGVVGAIVGMQIPRIYVSYAATARIRAFDDQLGDTLNLWVNALRTGFSVLQAMETIATELPPPISREFERIIQEVRLGINMEEAMENSLRRVPSEDYDLVITAVNIQREVGGNLAEILDVISFTIRERVRIKGEIRTLTAQGRASGWIITLLPIALAFVIYLINTEYIMELFTVQRPFLWPNVIPCGWAVVAASIMMIIGGGVAIQRIVDIEV